ncbi:MAG: thiamine pyrophosphate-binding protein [Candidatus Thorarchaeota archaeon]
MPKYTGGEIIAKYLIKEGVKYVIGIPGHGNLALTDAVYKDQDKITLIQSKQEMSAVHMAIGYYRITKQPLCVFTSIGPGAINTAIGIADAYVDSMPVLVLTGDTHVHMRGKGVLQEIERKRDSDMYRIQAFGCYSERVSKKEEIISAFERASNSAKPSVIEILVNREYPFTGSPAMGWWNVPVPTYLKDRRKKYEEEIKGEKL